MFNPLNHIFFSSVWFPIMGKVGDKWGGNKLVLLSLLIVFSTSCMITCNAHQEFVSCMASNANFLLSPGTDIYKERFNFSYTNHRKFELKQDHSWPVFIYTPHLESEIQAAVVCCKKHGLQIRVKSGGHDYESLSVLAQEPYIVIDLMNRRAINIDLTSETAWVETGATLGQLYWEISQKSPVHGFPGGACPSVGTGGHISGGGWGWLVRKYGLAADNVIDAHLIDVNGKLLTRETMGEDLFWAIRGSGGASFGIITAWKLKLTRVPKVVTLAKVINFSQLAVDQFYEWQSIAPQLPNDLFMTAFVKSGNQTFKSIFKLQFLGPANDLYTLMKEKFPLLGLKREDCHEMSWIEAVYQTVEVPESMEFTLHRTWDYPRSYKAKSDYITTPIPKDAIMGIYNNFLYIEENDIDRIMVMYPLGGRMDEFSKTDLPFPNRKGTLYGIEYMAKWPVGSHNRDRLVKWLSDLHKYMEPYASKSPRAAYINYKDLDLGTNNPNGETTYAQAKVWGEKYFGGVNFERLAKIKAKVDPENFFRNEQSVPPFK